MKGQAQLTQWWSSLEPQWKKAFNQAVIGTGEIEDQPKDDQLRDLMSIPVLRIVGPGGFYSNLSYNMTNLSGVDVLESLYLLVVGNASLTSLEGLEKLTGLKSLFVFNNQIQDLEPIRNLTNLEDLYIQDNNIKTLDPLQNLKNLRNLVCFNNDMADISVLGKESHPQLEKIEMTHGNKRIPIGDIDRLSRDLNIRIM